MPHAKKCRMKDCQSTVKTIERFHRFPADQKRCKEWVRLCGNEQILMLPAAKMPSRLYVCALHFSRQQYWSKYLDRLKSHNGGAVPDQLLGNPLSDELLDRWWKGETVESTTPSLHNSRTTNAEISKSKEMVSLFESSDQIKQSVSPGRLSCTSDHGNEGFLPMEYIDQADSDDDQPWLTQTSSLDSLELDTCQQKPSLDELSSTLEPNSGGILPMDFIDNYRSDDDKIKPLPVQPLPIQPLPIHPLPTQTSSVDSLESSTSVPVSIQKCPLESTTPNSSGPETNSLGLNVLSKRKIEKLTLDDFKTKKRAEMSLWFVKSKFKHMQHQVGNLKQNLKRAHKKIRELKSMLQNEYQSSDEDEETSDD